MKGNITSVSSARRRGSMVRALTMSRGLSLGGLANCPHQISFSLLPSGKLDVNFKRQSIKL